MRVEISHKFILGFIVVVASIVLLDFVVPHLGITEQWQQVFSIACALAIGLLLGWFFSRAFTANIRRLSGAAERLSLGDLSQYIRVSQTAFPDETSDLAASLNRVVESLRDLVGQIRSSALKVAESAQGLSATSEEMTAASHEVSNTVEQISRGAETQAEMVEKSSRLIREMAVSVELVAASAKKVAASAGDTAGTAEKGGEMARTSMEKMKQVLRDVEKNGAQILAFGTQVQQIGKIVEVITGIAQKTNLLALNATIEAARAGEYGRGFAVVAEEISKLADSTGKSAGEITQLVERVQGESRDIQQSMKESIAEIEAGRGVLDSSGRAFEEIIQTAKNTQTKAVSIAELADKQNEGAGDMVKAVDEISRVITDNAAATQEVSAATQQQSAAMEEMARSAQDLSALAEQLMGTVEQFRLEASRD